MATLCKSHSNLIPLCENKVIRRRSEWFVKPFGEVDFSKGVKTQRDNEISHCPLVFGDVFQPCQNEHSYQCSPDLDFHGVECGADEALYAQQLLEIAEENLNVPPCLVDCGYRGGGKSEVVCPLTLTIINA